MKGTVQYVPPEVFEHRQFSSKSDVFACGVMLYSFVTAMPELVDGAYVLHGEFPFSSMHTAPLT